MDINVHELLNLAASASPGAELFRLVCDGWAIEDPERAGPDGPRIGTIYVEDVDGHIEVRLVTRLPHPNTSTPTTFQVVAA